MTAYVPVEIAYTFKLDNALKIGSGIGKNSYIDNAFKTRTLANQAIIYEIPATSVKGHIRSTFEKMNHLFNIQADRVFGKERYAGWAHFSPLKAKKETVNLEWSSNTAIDRFRKAAKRHSLRVEEFITIRKGSYFIGQIDGYLENVDNQKEVYTLMLALIGTKRFGGDKSTGYGLGTIEIQSCKIGDLTLDETNIKTAIMDHLGNEVSQ